MNRSRLLKAGALLITGALLCTLSFCKKDSDDDSGMLALLGLAVAGQKPAPDLYRGGRLYDKWYGELGVTVPTSMTDNSGNTVDSKAHSYRCKNCHGWDLRGSAGIYGPLYQNKDYLEGRTGVSGLNFLVSVSTQTQFFNAIKNGVPGMPAYGSVMSDKDITDLAAYLVAMANNQLASPANIWNLINSGVTTPGTRYYTLAAGADAAAGKTEYAAKCAGCHGADGTSLLFDSGAYSLGTHTRMKAYEDWHKVLAGHPGSVMGSQVIGLTATQQESSILNIMAALCNRTDFPQGTATLADVLAGDPRCGTYLQ